MYEASVSKIRKFNLSSFKTLDPITLYSDQIVAMTSVKAPFHKPS